jgi:uncharacterized RDD family membrane protein YckC
MQGNELESWIEERVQEGFTPEQIEEELRKEEWSENEIQRAKQIARNKSQVADQTSSKNRESKLEFASLFKRAGANIIDNILLVIAFFVIVVINTFASNMTGISIVTRALSLPIFVLGTLGYFIVLEAKYGKTVGKKVLDLRVLKSDGSAVSYRESAIRNVLRLVDWLLAFYMIGIIAIISNEESQRIGDQVADTVVVQE